MPTAPRVRDLVSELGMSKGHASDILAGKRPPGLPLSIKIYRQFGVKLGPITNLSANEINTLEKAAAKRMGAT